MHLRFVQGLTLIFILAGFPAFSASVDFDLSSEGGQLSPELLNGTCLPIWNDAEIYDSMQVDLAGSGIRLLRFPNGTISNEYHWNGEGGYDSTGIWVSSDSAYSPGFGAVTRYRGTSKDHAGSSMASCIMDGDTSTFWWSDPGVSSVKPSFYITLNSPAEADSFALIWGNIRGIEYRIQRWDSRSTVYPPPHQSFDNNWVTLYTGSENSSRINTGSLNSDTEESSYYRVVIDSTQVSDSGVQVSELFLYSEGDTITSNEGGYSDDGTEQTKVTALGAHPGSDEKSGWSSDGWLTWDFERFMDYIATYPADAVPVICVNYSTGTPQEAAAWVEYANNIKDYGIEYWQIGNEMDGDWEEGGPVSALMYAERYLDFAKAMKEADPSIKLFGPVLANDDFTEQASGDYNGKSWMETFVEYIGAAEESDGTVYLDGVDFHSYPYWYSSNSSLEDMVSASDDVYKASDTLLSMIQGNLLQPDSTMVFLSEYNMSVIMTHHLQKAANGISLANIFGGFVEKFNKRGMTVVWDSYEGLSEGADGTYGGLSLFLDRHPDVKITGSLRPTAAYWSSYLTGSVWLDEDKTQYSVTGNYDRDNSDLRAYGVSSQEDFRALLINTGPESLSVDVNLTGSEGFSEAVIYSWGEQEYNWVGDDADAMALPGCGPSSERVATDSLSDISIPPYAMKVVRYGAPEEDQAGSPEVVFGGLYPGNVNSDDSLFVYLTAESEQGIDSLTYMLDDDTAENYIHGVINGEYSGPVESATLTIPGGVLGHGSHTISLIAYSGGETAVESIDFTATAELYPGILIDDFSDGNTLSNLPASVDSADSAGYSRWLTYAHQSDVSETSLEIDTLYLQNNEEMKADFNIAQPEDLDYDNFVSLNLPVDSTYLDTVSKGIHGITFRYSTTHTSPGGAFQMDVVSRQVTDYCNYSEPLEVTDGEWQQVSVSWNGLSQCSWGDQVGPLQLNDIEQFEFRMNGAGTGRIRLNNVAFLTDKGDSIELPVQYQEKYRSGIGEISVKSILNNGMVEFSLPGVSEKTEIEIYNLSGRRVFSSGVLRRGIKRYVWNPDGIEADKVSSGSYICRIKSGSEVKAKRLLIIE